MIQHALLFDPPPAQPAGFVYETEVISAAEEAALVRRFQDLPFEPFEFHGHLGNRRIASFGARYDYGRRALLDAPPLPAFLAPLCAKAAAFAGVPQDAIRHLMVTEYPPGAGIGWHLDKAVFDKVIGLSFLAPCAFRFRRRRGDGFERETVTVAPRSAYLLSGAARTDWEHSIPPMGVLRYSVTLRTLA